jgi:competence protein ComEA
MMSSARERALVILLGGLAVVALGTGRATWPGGGAVEQAPPCASLVEVTGRVARPGVVCARSVAEALGRSGGADGCAVPAADRTLRVTSGTRILVGQGEGRACAVRLGSMGGARRLAAGLRIDPNRASPEDLDALPRVGPGLAKRIAEDRDRRGPFRSVEALRRVRGIGPKTLDRLRPFLAVEER